MNKIIVTLIIVVLGLTSCNLDGSKDCGTPRPDSTDITFTGDNQFPDMPENVLVN